MAEIAKELGILTVALATKPFQFEGKQRNAKACAGLIALRKAVDTLIIVPNQLLLGLIDQDFSIANAFKKVDDFLYHTVKGISDLIMVPGLYHSTLID